MQETYKSVTVLNSSRFGQGNPRLGEKLMRQYLQSLSAARKTDALILLNSAVVLASQENGMLEELNAVEKAGTDIYCEEESCAFYSLPAQIGLVRNMDEITDIIYLADKTITL